MWENGRSVSGREKMEKKEDIPTGQFAVSCGMQVPSKKVILIHQKIITDK